MDLGLEELAAWFEAHRDESSAGARLQLAKLVLGLLAALTLLAWVGALLHRPRVPKPA